MIRRSEAIPFWYPAIWLPPRPRHTPEMPLVLYPLDAGNMPNQTQSPLDQCLLRPIALLWIIIWGDGESFVLSEMMEATISSWASSSSKLRWSMQHRATLCTTSQYASHQEMYPRRGRMVCTYFGVELMSREPRVVDDDLHHIRWGLVRRCCSFSWSVRGITIKIPASSVPPPGWN